MKVFRPYFGFLVVLASVAMAAMWGSEREPSYPPYIWGRPIAPGIGRAMVDALPTAPEWGGPTEQLSLSSKFMARPYGLTCISGLSQQQFDVEAGRVAKSRVDGTFPVYIEQGWLMIAPARGFHARTRVHRRF